MTSREKKYHDNKKVFKQFLGLTSILSLQEEIEFWRSVGTNVQSSDEAVTISFEKSFNLFLPPAIVQ